VWWRAEEALRLRVRAAGDAGTRAHTEVAAARLMEALTTHLVAALQRENAAHTRRADAAVAVLNAGLAHLVSLVSVAPAALLRLLRNQTGATEDLPTALPRKLLRQAVKGGFKNTLLNLVEQCEARLQEQLEQVGASPFPQHRHGFHSRGQPVA
jgi:hypothetical protein